MQQLKSLKRITGINYLGTVKFTSSLHKYIVILCSFICSWSIFLNWTVGRDAILSAAFTRVIFLFLQLQMFQNNNTIKTFAKLQHTWKIPFRVVILSIFPPFGYWIRTEKVNLFTKLRWRISQLLFIKLLSMGKKVLIIKLLCQTDMVCSAILFQKLFSSSMKTTLYFLNCFNFHKYGKTQKGFMY